MARQEEFTLAIPELIDALVLYEQATDREMSDVINRKATRICFAAAAKLKRAKATDINKHRVKKRTGEYENNLFHALASGGSTKYGRVVRGKGNRDTALKIYSSRKSAIGYSKAIWYSVAQDFGAKLRGKFDVKAAKGTKSKPTTHVAILETGNMEADLRNGPMKDALTAAAREEAADMAEYATKKLAKLAEKYSGR